MKYDIYFHNDFDGRASAAVVLAFLRSRGDDIEHFTPVDYDLLPHWLDEHFFEKHKLFKGRRNPPIIVDFLYHPKAAFWFEHHPTTFKKESWRKGFRPSKFKTLRAEYASCTHLVYDHLKKNFPWKPPRHLMELVKWLDVIDGANYRSAKQTLEMKEPAIQIGNFIEEKADSLPIASWTIKYLSERPIKDLAKEPRVAKVTKKVKAETKKKIAFYRKNLKIFGEVMFIDLSGEGSGHPARFVSYALHPKLVYTVRISPRNGLYHLNAGVNPWRRKENGFNIGNILKKYGGGGHEGVGGVEFKTKNEALRVAEDVIRILNHKGKK